MQETDRPIYSDAQAVRRIWQRVQAGREEVETAQEPSVQEQRPWDPVPFLQDAMVQTRLRGACCKAWGPLQGLGALYEGQARRLAAALFLLRGIRPMTPRTASGVGWSSLEETCRQLFLWERRAGEGYETALRQTGDPDLRDLFRELARESAVQQQRLRVILEARMG